MKYVYLCVIIATACLGLYFLGTQNPSELQIAIQDGSILRLHVVAASDDPYDQETKLLVRDAVLALCGPKLEAANGDSALMQAVIEENLPAIRAAATQSAMARGYAGKVEASFGVYEFPAINYAGEVVPAGEYKALRVVLGDGAGANWWCVMYPQLCFVGETPVTPGEQPKVEFSSSVANLYKKLFQGK